MTCPSVAAVDYCDPCHLALLSILARCSVIVATAGTARGTTEKEPDMDYVILIHGDESFPAPAPGSPEFQQFLSGWMNYNAELRASDNFVAGAGLRPTATATTIRRSFGVAEPTITDGPFAETKEQLGGFYLITAENLDEALEWAKKLPVPAGSIEVRPTTFRADQM